MSSRVIYFLLLIAVIAAGPVMAQENNNGKIYSSSVRWCGLPHSGVVQEVLVAPGDTVKAGQTLITYTLDPRIRQQLNTDLLSEGATQDLQIRLLEIRHRQQQLDDQRDAARRMASAGVGSSAAVQRLEEDRALLARQQRLVEDSIAHQKALRAARLQALEMKLDTRLVNGRIPELLRVTSPIDGQVLKLSNQMVPGMAFQPMDRAINIGVMDPVRIHTLVYEKEMVSLKVGDTAVIEVPSLDNQKITATITRINLSPVDQGLDRASYYEVDLEAANPDHRLIHGFKAVIYFHNGQEPGAGQ